MSTSVSPFATSKPRSADKGFKGVGMEGFIARWYARNTAKRDFGKCAELVTSQVAKGASILEVAPGPGYLAILLAKLGVYKVVGLDISQTFVEIATANAKEAGVAVEFRHGNAADMPFPPDSFDIIVCVAAFKNFSEPVKALGEMHRVLKPGGKALILDLRPDASPEAIKAEVRKMELSWFNSLLTKFTFKFLLLKRAYSQAQFRQMAAQSPFKTCEIQEDPIGLAVSFKK
jgi:ubiquinone/menaquinone biosynthesis C-methylase UbiE